MRHKFNWMLLATISLLLGSVGQARADTLVYATADNGVTNLFGTMDLTTGHFTQISTTTPLFGSLTAGPNGTLYGADINPPLNLYAISPSGVPSQYGTVTAPSNSYGFFGLASEGTAGFFADTGTLSGSFNDVNLYSISAVGNTLTAVGTMGTSFRSQNSGNLAFGPDGKLYFNATIGSNFVDTLYAVNTTTGLVTAIGSGLGSNDALAMTSNGTTLYGIDTFAPTNPTIYTIDTTTGAATAIGTVSGLPAGYTIDTLASTTVPEPSTLILACIPVLFSLCYVWRRRKANPAA